MAWFYGISTIVDHLRPNHFYTYINMISKQILKIRLLNEIELGFLHIVKWFHLISNNSVLHKYRLLLTQLVIGLNRVFCLHTIRCTNSSISNNSV